MIFFSNMHYCFINAIFRVIHLFDIIRVLANKWKYLLDRYCVPPYGME